MKPTIDSRLAMSATVLAIALLLFGAVIVRAVTVSAPSADHETAFVMPVSLLADTEIVASSPGTVSVNEIRTAADSDPFRADRRRPPRPYRIGGTQDLAIEQPPQLEQPPPPIPEPPAIRLLGTIATSNGGIAVLDIPGAGTRVVSVGNTVDGILLTSVGGRTATVALAGMQYALRVANPAPYSTPASQGRARQPAANNSAAATRALEQARQQQARERMQQLMQQQNRARGGANPGTVQRGGGGEN